MKIRIKAQLVQTGGRELRKGDVVDLADENARPLLDIDAAEVFKEKAEKTGGK
jgi:hypothetical protein